MPIVFALISPHPPIILPDVGSKEDREKVKNTISLKEEDLYGFHPDGPKFDQALINSLKKKDIETILKLDELYPGAGECGLRSFCFLLGILETSGINHKPEILSYEAPFGVGYLVVNFKFK